MAPPPRTAAWLLRRLLPSNAVARSIAADLAREYDERVGRGSKAAARRWYRRQMVGVVARATWDRVRGRVWGRRHHRFGRRRVWGGGVGRDLRFAVRSIGRRPLYALTVIGTLTLAIGANTAVFSVVNSVLLRPLPFPAPEELVRVGRTSRIGAVAYLDYRDWQAEVTTLRQLAAYTLARETFVAEGLAEEWVGVETSPELFATLGVPPLLGRALQPDTDTPESGSTAIVLSHRVWTERFGADSGVVGRTIEFEDHTRVVVGVMPPSFAFPTTREAYWTTLTGHAYLENRGTWFLRAVGRVRESSTRALAQRELNVIAERIDAREASEDSEPIFVVPLHDAVVGDTRPMLALLMGTVVLVLAIACANLANLGLTHAILRRREFAVRTALGAGTAHIVRQTLVEHVVLGVVGGVAALVLADVLVQVLLAFAPADLPRRDQIGTSTATFLFAAVAAIGCGVVFGIAPAWRHARADVRGGLQVGPRSGVPRASGRMMTTLAVVQIALAVVLTTGAALFTTSLARLLSTETGFETRSVLTLDFQLPRARYDGTDAVQGYYDAVTRRVEAMPGVRAVAFTSHLPLSQSYIRISYYLPGETADVEREPAELEVIDGPYFQVLGVPLLRGRGLDPTDNAVGPMEVVINRAMADLHWPGRSPLGERITLDDDFPDDRWMTVVGVVDNVRKSGLQDDLRPVVYAAQAQFTPVYGIISGRNGYMAFRVDGDGADYARQVVDLVRSEDPRVPLSNIRTLHELAGVSVATPRFRTLLLGAFAVLAIVVALVGVYGVLAFGVAQRAHEFGVRMALGADGGTMLRHVLARGVRLLMIGLPLGMAGSLLGGRWATAMLFRVTPTDPLVLGTAAILFSLMTIAACLGPARRAAAVDPLVSLRRD